MRKIKLTKEQIKQNNKKTLYKFITPIVLFIFLFSGIGLYLFLSKYKLLTVVGDDMSDAMVKANYYNALITIEEDDRDNNTTSITNYEYSEDRRTGNIKFVAMTDKDHVRTDYFVRGKDGEKCKIYAYSDTLQEYVYAEADELPYDFSPYETYPNLDKYKLSVDSVDIDGSDCLEYKTFGSSSDWDTVVEGLYFVKTNGVFRGRQTVGVSYNADFKAKEEGLHQASEDIDIDDKEIEDNITKLNKVTAIYRYSTDTAIELPTEFITEEEYKDKTETDNIRE